MWHSPLVITLCTLALSSHPIFAAKEPFNVSVSDQSPTIGYFPSRSGSSESTWNVTYSDSSWTDYVNQTIGQGVSSHYTTHVGANATLGWVGTAVYVWGEAADQDVQVSVDESSATATKVEGGWSVVGLQEGWHRVRVKVVGSGGVRLYGITFTTGLGESGATPVNTTVQAIFGQGSINGMFGASTGQWETGTQVGGGGGQDAQAYNRLDTYTPGSQLIFQPPSNTSFILLYGSVNFDHGQFAVALSTTGGTGVQASGDNGDGVSTTTTTTTVGTPANQQYRGDSPWISTDQVVYYALLDPKSQYTVTVENTGKGRQYWDVGKVVFIQAQGGSDGGSSTNTAAIAGGVIGGVVALALLGIILWFFVFRNRRKTIREEPVVFDDKPFEVDPYNWDRDDANAAYANAAAGIHTPFGGPVTPSGHGDPTMAPLLSDSSGRRESHNSHSSHLSGTQSPNLTLTGQRLSLASSEFGMNGYNAPYMTPPSSRHTSLQPTLENGGMILHNPDHAEHGSGTVSPYPHSDSAPTMASASETKSRMSASHVPRSRTGNGNGNGAAETRRSVIQEEDAGSAPPPAPPFEEHVIVPPSYNPAWAKDRTVTEEGSTAESVIAEGERTGGDQRSTGGEDRPAH